MKRSTMMVWMGVLLVVGAVMQSVAEVPSSITTHVPGTMNYQGRLVKPTGESYADGTYTFDIRLYTAVTGGTALWGGTYASFVKDGYFNIMLGGTGGAQLTGTQPPYTHTELWKALWPDTANGATGDSLYLSVTPWQDSSGNTIAQASRTPLSPRQTLLAAPYAFRAQTAEYANRSAGTFAVGGSFLTPDNMLVASVIDNSVSISAHIVSIVGGLGDLMVRSMNKMTIKAVANMLIDGNDSITMNAVKDLNLVSTTEKTLLKGQKDVNIESSTGVINLKPSTDVRGRGNMKWTLPGASEGTFEYPMEARRGRYTLAPNTVESVMLTDDYYDKYSIMIVGVRSSISLNVCAYKNTGTGKWEIRIIRTSTDASASSVNVDVDVLVINKNWIGELRYQNPR